MQAKPKTKASPTQLASSASKRLRTRATAACPYTSAPNLSPLKKPQLKFNSSSPEHPPSSSESYKLLSKTFALSKGDVTDSSELSTKVSLALPSRPIISETKRKPSANERVLQTKLASIKAIEFNIYSEVFDETLSQLTTYRQVLEEVKQGYDARISSLEEANSAQEAQIESMQQRLEDEERDKGVFQHRLKRLAQENYKLSV
jgi:uncharacterized coiled-coil protein SlyX